jgi:ELM2 domain
VTGKTNRLIASKIHGVAPIRKPRVGPEYQATIPELQGRSTAQEGSDTTAKN